MRHSGGESRRWTSPTVTLYLDVELSRESRPGTEQKTSLGFVMPPTKLSLASERAERLLALEGSPSRKPRLLSLFDLLGLRKTYHALWPMSS